MEDFPDNIIIKNEGHTTQLHDWIKEDGLDARFNLFYRSSRDGKSAEHFHSRYDNNGSTIYIIKTTDGFVLGGYSNNPML